MYKHTINGMIKRISDKIKCRADNNLKEHDLTFVQSRVLRYLACYCGGSCTQKEIGEYLQVSHPTVVGIIARMEQSGFVRTETMPSDKRNTLVIATQKAIDASQQLQEYMKKMEAKMLTGLSEQQQSELLQMLQQIYANID